MTDDRGPVEHAWRQWVATLGELSPRQNAEAETLYRIAEELDLHSERPASALGTLRRALTATVDKLMTEKGDAPRVEPPGDVPEPPNVIPADVVETARLAREQRRQSS